MVHVIPELLQGTLSTRSRHKLDWIWGGSSLFQPRSRIKFLHNKNHSKELCPHKINIKNHSDPRNTQPRLHYLQKTIDWSSVSTQLTQIAFPATSCHVVQANPLQIASSNAGLLMKYIEFSGHFVLSFFLFTNFHIGAYIFQCSHILIPWFEDHALSDLRRNWQTCNPGIWDQADSVFLERTWRIHWTKAYDCRFYNLL